MLIGAMRMVALHHSFGDAPKVTSTDLDGAWAQRWDKDRQIMLIEADPSQKMHTITVRP